ncbi:putative alginate O-acetylase [Salinicola sp. NYA28a]
MPRVFLAYRIGNRHYPMVFSSPLFIFVFLPLVWAGYQSIAAWRSSRALVIWLAVASCVFYAAWDYWLLPVLLSSIFINYAVARRLQGSSSRVWLWLGVAFNLGMLGYFKYRVFALSLYEGSLAPLETLVLPLGISFFTFQQIAFLVDVNRRLTRVSGFVDYLLFVSFFPQLIAGPIVHHRELAPQLAILKRPSARQVQAGLLLFAIGLTKKLLVADQLAPFVDHLFAKDGSQLVAGDTLLAGWAYGMQLYFDFSGYADMAIGLGLMFGVQLPANFDSPYKAKSIQDFWRRWHITLSTFLRDYLYIPLGGNRYGLPRQLSALLVTMLLGGLWHGAGWQFVVWGGLHGLALGLYVLWRRRVPYRLPSWVGWGVTFVLVMLAWVPFRAEGISQMMAFYSALGTPGLGAASSVLGLTPSDPMVLAQPGLLLVFATVVAVAFPNARQILEKLHDDRLAAVRGLIVGVAIVACAKTMIDVPTQAFLYFNF